MTQPVDELYSDGVSKEAGFAQDTVTGDGAPSIIGQCINEAVTPEETLEYAVNRLAAMKKIEYVQVRKAEAKKHDIPVGILDDLIREAQQKSETASHDVFPEVEPWPEPVDGVELLNEITQTINRFMICEPETARATALWIVMTWFIDVIQVAPLAVITAPEPRCGKSQLLDLIGFMSKRNLNVSNVKSAALYRAIELWHPTFVIDEADAFMKENEELRGILNAGHTRTSAYVLRCEGDDNIPKKYDVWGAKAIAGIGRLAPTLMDRSITLELRRKLKSEQVERIRHAEQGLFENMCRKLCRYAEDNEEIIRNARPELPDELNDRAQDNWEPLLAIADLAGGEWSDIARNDAIKISGDDNQTEQSIGVQLLSDIKEIFDEKNTSKFFTSTLINELCNDSEKSWESYNRGNPITARQLANRLKEYGINSKNIRIGVDSKKGYEKDQFADAWARYLTHSPDSPVLPATTPQPSTGAGFSVAGAWRVADANATNEKNAHSINHTQKRNAHEDVADTNATRYTSATVKPSTGAGCSVVTDKKGGTWEVFSNNAIEGSYEVEV